MRIAIISDIHGNYAALEAVLRDLERAKPDRIINLGDLIFRGPQPAECLAELERLGATTIRGNTDEFFAEQELKPALRPLVEFTLKQCGDRDLAFLMQLPFATTELLPGGEMLCIHGTPRYNTEPLFPWSEQKDPTILAGIKEETVACGHQHLAYQYRCMSGHLILSTGSVGFPLDGDPRPAYTLLDAEPGRFTAANIRVEYDWRAMLAEAERRGYPDMDWLAHVAQKGLMPKQ